MSDTTPTTPAEVTPATVEAATPAVAAPKRKKLKRSVPFGQVHILATFNNTIITVTDPQGGALTFSSAGACGFRGSKKGTAYAAQVQQKKPLAKQSKLTAWLKRTFSSAVSASAAMQLSVQCKLPVLPLKVFMM